MFEALFESWGAWGWVAFAWAQLIVAYTGYLGYLNWREKRLEREEELSNE